MEMNIKTRGGNLFVKQKWEKLEKRKKKIKEQGRRGTFKILLMSCESKSWRKVLRSVPVVAWLYTEGKQKWIKYYSCK